MRISVKKQLKFSKNVNVNDGFYEILLKLYIRLSLK